MKNNRNGQAEILTDDQLLELLNEMEPRHQLLFGICFYTSCRVSEALKLIRSDFKSGVIVFRAATTKTNETREIQIIGKLQRIIDEVGLPKSGFLFPGKNSGHLTRQAADAALRKACDFIGLEGVSTHSFRRTSITKMYRSGVDLKTIQAHTKHKSMESLIRYVEVDKTALQAALEVL
jgi:integrase/recombinase XerD